MTGRFEGRVVLVTGGAGGIGAASAIAFAAEGAIVAVADRDAAGAEATAVAIRAGGGQASGYTVDIADEASVNALVASVVDELGGLHIAFNNAGVPTPIVPSFDELTPEIWRNVIDINLTGTYLCMRAEAPALRASGGTAIVNTASIQSLRASAGQAGYIASKHGVAGLTKAVALDLIGDGIRVNAVCPGFISTPMMAQAIADPGIKAFLEDRAPIHRIAEADEVARAVLFLASDEASYCVGALLSVDGGLAI
jgi:NAD(P)-dependent dehydrogenase (short-subunit alcohol dehydrogenase family)